MQSFLLALETIKALRPFSPEFRYEQGELSHRPEEDEPEDELPKSRGGSCDATDEEILRMVLCCHWYMFRSIDKTLLFPSAAVDTCGFLQEWLNEGVPHIPLSFDAGESIRWLDKCIKIIPRMDKAAEQQGDAQPYLDEVLQLLRA